MITEIENKNKIDLRNIYEPISTELSNVEIELKNQINDIVGQFTMASTKQVIEHFFRTPGKLLRPALVLLSAKSVTNHKSLNTNHLVQLATAVELIHNASLIHDDIIDEATVRRGQSSINNKFGNKIAVLAGDILYARAFSILINSPRSTVNSQILEIISKCVEKMCDGEINELSIGVEPLGSSTRTKISAIEEYLKIIENKTASFMSACCECGAILGAAEEKILKALKDFGFYFGMTYQIVDDYIDRDSGVEPLGSLPGLKPLLQYADEFVLKSKQSIEILPDSVFKEKLFDLVDYISGQI